MTTPTITWRTHYALIILAMIYIFNYIDRLLISILIEPIKLEFGVSDTLIGLLSGLAFALFYTAFGFPFGRLADRIGRRPVVVLACIAWSGMTMLCGVATSFLMLLLFRIGVAVGEAGGTAPSVAMVSELYPPHRRAMALAVFMMGPSLGAVFGLGLGGWIADEYGWRTAFIVIGAPGVLLGLLLALTVKVTPVVQITSSSHQQGLMETLKELLATPSYLLVIAAGSIAAVGGYAIGTWGPSFLLRSHALTLQEAGMLIGVIGGAMSAIGTILCGALTDKLVAKNPAWQLGVALIGTLACIPFGLGYFLWPEGTAFMLGKITVPEAFLFYIGFAFFGTWWSVPCFGAITHLFQANKLAQATSIFVMSMTLFGVGLGPLVVGVLSDIFESTIGTEALRYALASSVGMFGLSAVCLMLAIPKYANRINSNQECYA